MEDEEDDMDGQQHLEGSSSRQDMGDGEEQHDGDESQGVVDYDQIEVELDEDQEEEEGGMHQGDSNDEDPENEVSINLEDAIATAEEIGKQQMQFGDDENGLMDDEDDEDADAIAGIVTDGHNQKDQFD